MRRSSAVNAMIFIRGDPHDFDQWRDLAGTTCCPTFIRSEDHVLGVSAWHGADGPPAGTAPTAPSPIAHAFVDAAVACEHHRNPDFSDERRDGAGLILEA
jgi:choline dehydrogenase